MPKTTNKEYEAVAGLIRGFLEEMEFASYDALPSVKDIVRGLRSHAFFERGITASQLGCAAEDEQAVFIYFDEGRPPEEQFKLITGDPLEEGGPMECYLVVFVRTIEAKQTVDALKAEINEWAKKWLKNRKDGRRRSKVRFCTLHTPTQEEKNFSIAIKSRINSLNYVPEPKKAVRIASNVYVAKLFDIVSLYNQVGTELFERNVRYHIGDVLSVESEIRKTLTQQPEDFFNSNNGIAIQIKKSEDLDTRDERGISLTYSEKGDLSVINGAQTISAAADFFFQQPQGSDGAEDLLNAVERARKQAWVLLRVFYPKNGAQEDCLAAFNHISISLNRQKPINPMDIGYTCPAVMEINKLYEKNRSSPYYFRILKRGQNEPGRSGRFKYQLADFGRMVTAYYYDNPATARSSSTQDIIRYREPSADVDESEGTDKTIYASLESSNAKSTLFLEWYKPINFASKIAQLYGQVEKNYRKQDGSDANVLAVLGNGRYFFVAYVVNMLNGTPDAADGAPSFAGFGYDADMAESAKEQTEQLILQYAQLVAEFAAGYLKATDPDRNTLNSNDFKTQSFYKKWRDHAKTAPAVLKWNAEMKAALCPDGAVESEAS